MNPLLSQPTSLFLTLAVQLFIAAVYLLMPAMVMPTLPFGVRVPLAYTQHPAVVDERRRYTLRIAALTGAVLLVDGALGRLTQWSFLRPASILLVVAGCWGIYYLSHRQIRQVKTDEQWYADVRQVVTAPAAPRSLTPDRRFWQFLAAPVAVIALTMLAALWRYPAMPETLHYTFPHLDAPWTLARQPWSALLPAAFQALTTLVLSLFAWTVGNGRLSVDVEDPGGSLAYQKAVTWIVQVLIFLLAVGMNLTFLLAGLSAWGLLTVDAGAQALVLLLPLGVWLIAAPGLLLGLRRDTPPPAASGMAHRDDDTFWKLGMFYFNRDDPAVLVSRRFGVGRTLNFGHPISWALMAALAAWIVFRLFQQH